MIALRSLIFNVAFFGGGLLMAIALLPVLAFSRDAMLKGLGLWSGMVQAQLRWIVGLNWEIKGLENLPDEPCIFACKHQSAWETGIFYQLLDRPAYIMKKELLSIPFLGWELAHSGVIAIDRDAGVSALKQMIAETRERLERGQNVIIFPEGTRAKPGFPGTYHTGVAALYKGVGMKVVPVALNSGLFWQRRSFLKRPGRITLEFLPAIEPGMDRRAFMETLKSSMETATNALIERGRNDYSRALPKDSSTDSAPSS